MDGLIENKAEFSTSGLTIAQNKGKSLNQRKNSLKQKLAKSETLDKKLISAKTIKKSSALLIPGHRRHLMVD